MDVYYIDAWCFGLGWICFGYRQSRGEAEQLEAAARDASAARFPGKAPRPTRIRTRQGAETRKLREREGAFGK